MIRPKRKDYKSNLEHSVAIMLWEERVPFEYEKESWEFFSKPYKAHCVSCGSSRVVSTRSYTPDFFLPGGIVLEVKGKFLSKHRTMLLDVIKEWPKADLRLVFMRDNWLTKKHAMRYSDWCRRYGITCYINDIPEEVKRRGRR